MKSVDNKELGRLVAKVEDLSARQLEAQNDIVRLQRLLHEEQNRDLDAEATAYHAGEKPPKPKAPEVEKRLRDAEHDFEVIQRALGIAQGELGKYYSEHAAELMDRLQDAKAQRAKELSEAARPVLEKLHRFYEPDDDARALKPYLTAPQEENTGPAQDTVLLFRPMTTQNIFGTDRIAGLHRGEVEAVLGALASLGAQYAAGGDAETTIVGEVDEGAA